MPETMKAVRISQPNMQEPAKAIAVEELPVPEPQEGEILLRFLLRPVNPADIFSLTGTYGGCAPVSQWPTTPGLDGMGVVAKTGPGATKFSEGQRVAIAGLVLEAGNGTWTEYGVYKETDLVAVPDSVSDEAAAQFWTNPITIYGMMNALNLSKGSTVVIAAAGSALGRMGIDLAKHMGLKTIGTVRRDEQRQEILDHGADYCFSETGEALTAKIREATGGEGADAALDCIGGDFTHALTAAVRPKGQVVLYGAMAGAHTVTVPLVAVAFQYVQLRGFWINVYMHDMTQQQKAAAVAAVMGLIEQGVLKPGAFAGKKFSLQEAAAAVAESAKAARGEKVFIASA